MPYLLLKALHVASVLIFIGGLSAQLFAFAVGQAGDFRSAANISGWDRRVTMPAMLAVWLTGAAIAAEGGFVGSSWLWAKLVLVLGLTGLHGVLKGKIRRMEVSGEPNGGLGASRIATAVATSASIIAVLVVTKPM